MKKKTIKEDPRLLKVVLLISSSESGVRITEINVPINLT